MRVLVTGGTGLLGYHLLSHLVSRGHEVYATFHRSQPPPLEGVEWVPIDLEDPRGAETCLSRVKPEVVVHTAAYTDVDGCETNRALAHRVNYLATSWLAGAAASAGAFLVYVSTDYVFDGERGLYREDDIPAPVNFYGLTKLLGEVAVASRLRESALIVRVSGLFGFSPTGKKNFGLIALESLARGSAVNAFSDQYLSPTYVPFLAQRLVRAVERGVSGVLHLAGERASRVDFALMIAEAAGADKALVRPVPMGSAKLVARRPRDSSLDTSKASSLGLAMPPLRECVEHFVKSYREVV